MIIKLKTSELKEIPWIKHNKTADGYSYECDTYTFPTPLCIDLKGNDCNEYIHFDQPVRNIQISNILTSNQYNMKIKLLTGSKITFTTTYSNYYTLNIYTDDKKIIKHLKNEND